MGPIICQFTAFQRWLLPLKCSAVMARIKASRLSSRRRVRALAAPTYCPMDSARPAIVWLVLSLDLDDGFQGLLDIEPTVFDPLQAFFHGHG